MQGGPESSYPGERQGPSPASLWAEPAGATPPAPPYVAGRPVAPPPPPYAWDVPQENLRRLTMNGWLCVIVGLLIPLLELVSVAVAIKLLSRDRIGHGVSMLVSAVVIFAARFVLFALE